MLGDAREELSLVMPVQCGQCSDRGMMCAAGAQEEGADSVRDWVVVMGVWEGLSGRLRT